MLDLKASLANYAQDADTQVNIENVLGGLIGGDYYAPLSHWIRSLIDWDIGDAPNPFGLYPGHVAFKHTIAPSHHYYPRP